MRRVLPVLATLLCVIAALVVRRVAGRELVTAVTDDGAGVWALRRQTAQEAT
jgi:hypothetical protein